VVVELAFHFLIWAERVATVLSRPAVIFKLLFSVGLALVVLRSWLLETVGVILELVPRQCLATWLAPRHLHLWLRVVTLIILLIGVSLYPLLRVVSKLL